MKKIGIGLLVLQVLALLGSVANGEFSELFVITGGYDIGETIGFFLPAIVGGILVAKAGNKRK